MRKIIARLILAVFAIAILAIVAASIYQSALWILAWFQSNPHFDFTGIFYWIGFLVGLLLLRWAIINA